MRPNDEEKNIAEVIRAARVIQEFLWGGMNRDIGLEEFKRMFRKRVAKIDEIRMSNPHWRVEMRKRLLQTAAISVNMIAKIDNDEIRHDGIHPTVPSNLPQFDQPISGGDGEADDPIEYKCPECGVTYIGYVPKKCAGCQETFNLPISGGAA